MTEKKEPDNNKEDKIWEKVLRKYKLGGRPVSFKTPEEFLEKIYEFLYECESRKVDIPTKNGFFSIGSPAPTTVEGFCVFAGITKSTFYEYENKKRFKRIIEQYQQIVENYFVNQLTEGKPGNKADFVLKNMKPEYWKDKTEVKHSGDIKSIAVQYVEDDADDSKSQDTETV